MLPISHLFERLGNFARGKVNAPMFAWSIYYDSKPPFISGHSNHKQKFWQGITIDDVIPTSAINELNSINSIEARASCQGTLTDKNEKLEVPTYFIFRTALQDPYYIDKLVKKLNKYPDIKAGSGVGNQKDVRIGVVGDMSYETNPHAFIQWWNTLPKRIKESL
jgi:hypothetical protein